MTSKVRNLTQHALLLIAFHEGHDEAINACAAYAAMRYGIPPTDPERHRDSELLIAEIRRLKAAHQRPLLEIA